MSLATGTDIAAFNVEAAKMFLNFDDPADFIELPVLVHEEKKNRPTGNYNGRHRKQ